MNKTQIHAEIVGHSLNPQGDELISVLCTFPRIILAEVNTHRMLSKNTSSSRAIPFKKMVEAVQNNPFIPIAWQKEHKGMQGTEYFTEKKEIKAKTNAWIAARDNAIQSAKFLNSNLVVHEINGEDFISYNQFDEDSLEELQAKERLENTKVTKQLCNRLLEPFMWTTMLITGSKEGWDNFFSLRCPQYLYDYEDEPIYFKSKKDWVNYYNESQGYKENNKEFTKVENLTELEWLQINKGQAEIHIMDLAEKIYDCIQESVPTQLKENEWHIPMISDLESLKLSTDDQIKLSVGRAANTSYTVVGDGKELTLEHAIKIHDKCKELNHSSVFEHCARAMNEVEYTASKSTGYTRKGEDQYGWCNNLKGFIPYRYLVDNKINI